MGNHALWEALASGGNGAALGETVMTDKERLEMTLETLREIQKAAALMVEQADKYVGWFEIVAGMAQDAVVIAGGIEVADKR
jgi:hypothetical protein